MALGFLTTRNRWCVAAVVAVLLVVAGCSSDAGDERGGASAVPNDGPIVASGGAHDDAPDESIPQQRYLGTPFSGDSLANLDVGGPDDGSVAYRFLAERSGTVSAVRPYIVVNTSREGYAAGTGGTVRVSLVADDGAGLPAEDEVLAVGEIEMALVDGKLPPPADTEEKRAQNYPSIPLGGQPIVAGQTYHLVFEQVDPDPVANYVGLDLLYQTTPELGPRPSAEEWGVSIATRAARGRSSRFAAGASSTHRS